MYPLQYNHHGLFQTIKNSLGKSNPYEAKEAQIESYV